VTDSEIVARLLSASGPIALETQREVELYRALPIEQRKRIDVWLGHALPLWTGDCVRCDRPLQYANDSYGTGTCTRTFRCSACGWRDEQPTDAPTFSELLSEQHRHDELAKRLAVTDQAALPAMPTLTIADIANVTREPDSTEARRTFAASLAGADLASAIRVACELPLPTHWDRRNIRFDRHGWYGPIVELLGDLKRDIIELHVAQGFVDFVVMSAREFLPRADDLFTRAPVRCVELLDAGSHVDALLRSPHLSRLVGLGLEASMVSDLPRLPRLPRLRHFALRSRHEVTLAELSELAHSPGLEAATCVHLRTPALVESDDRDYATVYSWSEYGLAVKDLATRTKRRWLDELLRPAIAAVR
jgi:hypothetical protein